MADDEVAPTGAAVDESTVDAIEEACKGDLNRSEDKVEKLDKPGKDNDSSHSSSSRSSSSSSSSKSATNERKKFTIDDHVEVFGMESEKSKFLNGRKGTIVQWIEEHARFEVCFGPERLALVRADNLRKCDPPVAAVKKAGELKIEKPKVGSLADLLGKPPTVVEVKAANPTLAEYKPLWERSGAANYAGPVMKSKDLPDTEESRKELEEEHRQSILEMQEAEQERQEEEAELRQKIVDELAASGIHDEDMIEATFQEQLSALKEERLLRPQERKGKKRSRSSSSSKSGTKTRAE